MMITTWKKTCRRASVGILTLLSGLGVSLPAGASIYHYVDESGVMHFTNVPVGGKYRLYYRSGADRILNNVDMHALAAPFQEAIAKAARRYQIHPDLLRAVIMAESSYNPYAVSSKGAMGLMQLMPQTVEEMRVGDPFDPPQNIFGGAAYLKKLLTRFDNDLSLSLAAYNCGATTVDQYGGIPPYEETRNYIRKVLNYFRWCRANPSDSLSQ